MQQSDRKYSALKCRLHDIHTVLIFICNFRAKDECEYALLESTNYPIGSWDKLSLKITLINLCVPFRNETAFMRIWEAFYSVLLNYIINKTNGGRCLNDKPSCTSSYFTTTNNIPHSLLSHQHFIQLCQPSSVPSMYVKSTFLRLVDFCWQLVLGLVWTPQPRPWSLEPVRVLFKGLLSPSAFVPVEASAYQCNLVSPFHSLFSLSHWACLCHPCNYCHLCDDCHSLLAVLWADDTYMNEWMSAAQGCNWSNWLSYIYCHWILKLT